MTNHLRDNLPDGLMAARRRLGRIANEIREELDKFSKLSLGNQLDGREKCFRDVLFRMAEGLSSSLADYDKYRRFGKPIRHFYFWPGYNSLPVNVGLSPTRITLLGYVPDQHRWVSRGFSSEENDKLGPTSIWFDALLTERANSYTPNSKLLFKPGGTHEWLQQDKSLHLSDGTLLEAMLISPYSQENEEPMDGVLKLRLSREPSRWGRELAEQLNDPTRISSSEIWPFSSAPLPEPQKHFKELREDLYTAWLGANFLRNWTEEMPTVLESLLGSCRELELGPLEDSIREALRLSPNGPAYHTWTVLVLQRAPLNPRIKGATDLGSAMLLTTDDAPPLPWLYFVRRWIEQVYLWMRLAESSMILQFAGPLAHAQYVGHEAGVGLTFARRFIRHIRDPRELSELANAAIDYARCCLVESNPEETEWALNDTLSLNTWVASSIKTAWSITLTSILRGAQSLNEVANDAVAKELVRDVSSEVTVKLNSLTHISPTVEERTKDMLCWNLSRWLLAALTNALRWAAMGSNGTLPQIDGKGYITLAPVEVELTVTPGSLDPSTFTSRIAIRNRTHGIPGKPGKLYGTEDTLYFISAGIPGFSKQNFREIVAQDLAHHFSGRGKAFETVLEMHGAVFFSRK